MFIKLSYAVCDACAKRIGEQEKVHRISTSVGIVEADGVVYSGNRDNLMVDFCVECFEALDASIKAFITVKKRQAMEREAYTHTCHRCAAQWRGCCESNNISNFCPKCGNSYRK